jgi:hypothetical protein
MKRTAAAMTPSPVTEHDVSPSNALRLSAAAFQIRAILANLPTGNYWLADTWLGPCGEAGLRRGHPSAFFLEHSGEGL